MHGYGLIEALAHRSPMSEHPVTDVSVQNRQRWRDPDWIEKDFIERDLEAEADEVVDAPRSDASFVGHLPLREWGLTNCPAIPYWADPNGNPDWHTSGRR